MKYKLLMFAKEDCIILDKINAEEVIKSLKLFKSKNIYFTFKLYEYSANADYEDFYFEVLDFWS